ncbi:MAG: branched-chain amino acid transport system ATP-binding protein livF [Actinomycetota bacterium]
MITRLKAQLSKATGGGPVFPLAILSVVYFFDEFDTAAFAVLAPNIKEHFGLSDGDFAGVVLLNLSIVLLLAIPAGYIGDRGPRRLITVVCGIAAGFCSMLTGIVGTVTLLLIVRTANGIGNLANGTVQKSLLADFYAPEVRSNVFAVYLAAPAVGSLVGGPVAGALASAFGWRAPFFIFFVPIVVIAALCLRLREPLRGESDDATAAVAVATEKPPTFGEAARTLWAVPTLRRQYMAYSFIGAGLLPLAFTIPLFYEREFNVGELGRGFLTSLTAAAMLAGTLFVAPKTRRWIERDVGEPLRWIGGFTAVVGVLLVLLSQAPNTAVAVAITALAFFVAGMYIPPFTAVQALVAPARVRTMAFAFGSIFLVGGVVILYLVIPVADLSDTHGIRVGLAALGPYWLIAGAILASASAFVADDSAAALRSLAALAKLRERRAASGETPLLSCAGLDVAYDSVQVLFGVDFEVEEGEIVALLGTNGAGKSTLLKAISGLQPPSAGSIILDGRDITRADARATFDAGIVQMPGGRSVFPTLTVDECLRLAVWTSRREPEHAQATLAQAVEYFPVLTTHRSTLAGNLSGGEQQMLGLAMAFIARPRLLMIDELSLGLAPTIVSQLVDIVRAIHAAGTTVIVVEQSVNVALTLAQRAVFMEKGEVRFTGPTSDLLDRADLLRAVFLEGAAKATGVDVGAPADAAPKRSRASVPARVDDALERPAPVLELVGISVHFGGIRAVQDVDLAVHRDEVVGLIGPNGAGKTTLFDAVSGFVNTDSGFVFLNGLDVTGWGPDRRGRGGLGRSFQDARIFPSLTVVENLALALERHLDVRDPLACALGLPAVFESEAQAALQVHELVELLGLDAYRNKFVGELSTGTRRMVDLAMAVAHGPDVLLLDEPSSGIAQRETEALGPVLKRIQREVGCALVVIEHDMPLITALADTMVALETGRVIARGTPTEVTNDPEVVASYLGDDEDAIMRSGQRRRRPRKKAAPR